MENSVHHLHRINRVLDLVSRISRACVRANSPDALYFDVSKIAVNCGMFNFASIGLIDPSSNVFRHFASWGSTLQFSSVPAASDDLVGRVSADAKAHVFEEWDDAYRAIIGLPLQDGGAAKGVFILQTDQPGFFDHAVVELLTDAAEDISFALVHMEIDQRRLAAETKLHYLAFYNSQTGLPSGAMLDERLLSMAESLKERSGILLLLDIKLQKTDQLLQLLGNAGMDVMLREFAIRLEHGSEGEIFVAQLAQDEFAFAALLQDGRESAKHIADDVHTSLTKAIRVADREIFVQASVGAAIFPLQESEVKYLLRRARAAAEQYGGEYGVRFYSADLDRDLELRVQMAADLHRALERDEFLLYYQPQLNLKTGAVVGVEALIRWQHPEKGLVSPGVFIPLLEDGGLMPEVGAWALSRACSRAKAWHDQGFSWLRIAVNMSAQQFRMADLVPLVKGVLDDSGLDAEFLELELTESLILESAEKIIHTMRELKELGVSLSLDDFGTGYSSLGYLRHYPVDRIKIDQSFIRDMTVHPESAALVRSILAMAANLGLTAIAEGVETEAQCGYLRKQACEEIQGFLFSRPLPEHELIELLRDGRRLEVIHEEEQANNTVLFVDDEPNVLTAMRRLLYRENWKILTAVNAAEALDLMAEHSVCVIISDQRMPGMTGTELLHRVKEMYPDTIRILLTGHADFSTVINAVNQGDLFKVLTKPIDDQPLRENIRNALHRHEMSMENQRLSQRLANLEQAQDK